MNLPLFIAGRYLFARKSHNVINIISAISAIGLAVGTAALILILSVYNGFNDVVEKNLSDTAPDVCIVPSGRGTFDPDSCGRLDFLTSDPAIKDICPVLEYSAFIRYGNNQGIVRIKGVDGTYEEIQPLEGHISSGKFTLWRGDVPLASVGNALAYRMGISPRFLDPIEIYYPDPSASVSVTAAESALRRRKVYPSSLFSVSAQMDDKLVIVPLEIATDLYGRRLSGLEIHLKDGSAASVRRFISSFDVPGFTALDKYGQHESIYKMMKMEKAAVFFILILVVLVISLNIFGSLSMLIIEKTEDIGILQAMGADKALTRRIFILEGWLISLLGMAVGLVTGVVLALVQQHFGIIKMPGNFLVESYPVIIKWSDVLLTALGVSLSGLLISLLPKGGKSGC